MNLDSDKEKSMAKKSTPTPHVATGVTVQDLDVKFGAGGSSFTYDVTVPAGTRCRKLDGGSDPWVVADLSFIEDKRSIMYSDADIYGIRIPESEITNIQQVR
jgi:hypothetical protein